MIWILKGFSWPSWGSTYSENQWPTTSLLRVSHVALGPEEMSQEFQGVAAVSPPSPMALFLPHLHPLTFHLMLVIL
jgi:hypothetical protein